MAIDTERKRRSAVAISLYALGPSVLADGGFDQGDRQTIGYGYSGNAAPGPVVGGSGDDQIRLGPEPGSIVSPRPVLGGWMG